MPNVMDGKWCPKQAEKFEVKKKQKRYETNFLGGIIFIFQPCFEIDFYLNPRIDLRTKNLYLSLITTQIYIHNTAGTILSRGNHFRSSGRIHLSSIQPPHTY